VPFKRNIAVAAMMLASLTGCSGDAYGPKRNGGGEGAPVGSTASVIDPTGDLFGSGDSRWDLTAKTVARDTGGITEVLEFSRDVLSPVHFDSAAMFAVVDLDLDQNGATGRQSVVDEFRLDGGATGIRDEGLIDLTRMTPDSTVPVTDSLSHALGFVKPVISGNRVTVRVPRALIGNDEGGLNVTAIVGNRANPTDFIPNAGHLTLGRDPRS